MMLAGAGAQANAAVLSEAVFAYTNSGFSTILELETAGGTIQLDAIARGWYQADGGDNGSSSGSNYIAGVCGSLDSCSGNDTPLRNWFAFDLEGIQGPVTAATLFLAVPPDNGGDLGFYSPQGTETYSLYSIELGVPAIVAGAGIPGYDDLGTGTEYGSNTYTAADMGTTPGIVLNAAALAAINEAVGGDFGIGGALTTLENSEVPEPLTWTMMGAGLSLLALRRRK